MKQKNKIISKIIFVVKIIFLFIIFFIISFGVYVSNYYRATDTALSVLEENKDIVIEDNLTVLFPKQSTDTAIIFYPGAKVEDKAYLPLLDKIREKGVVCILVRMPFRMAIFDSNAAQKVMLKFPNIKHWYISGHSMGGAMASKFASDNPEKLDGLILLGAYIYGDYSVENTLTIYGSLNKSVENHINYTKNIVKIDGGNHSQFGNYGLQKGDLVGKIDSEEQQRKTVLAIEEFIKNKNVLK